MNLDRLETLAASLARVGSTRRGSAAGLFAGAAALLGSSAEADAKKRGKKKNKKKRRKNRKKGNSGGSSIGKPAHVSIGAYVPRILDDSGVYNDFTKAIGRAPDFLVWYEDWANGNFNNGHRNYLDTIEQRNLTAVIDWEPFDSEGDLIDQPTYRLSTIYNGNHNSYIDSWATGLATYGKPVFIKFAHEMNGGWFPWGVGVNGNSKTDYVRAFRHIHNRFASRGADNVRWVWVPNYVYDTIPATLEDVYPGDDYTDWLGMNGYNWGTSVYWESCPCRSSWDTFGEVFAGTYRDLLAIADKPIMIGETASSEKGGNKSRWITNAFVNELPNNYPNVRAVTWFNTKATGLDTNQNGEVVPTATVDWRITSSDEARKAFRNAVANEYYKKSLKDI